VPTIEEMDAELAWLRANLRRNVAQAIAEITEELETETNPYAREFLEGKLKQFRAMDGGDATVSGDDPA
jgi:hypothetical protein